MKITLYVDTVSPFAYEAYYILRHDPVFSKCEIEYVPIFLGGVMKACGNTPPINIKNKDKWIVTERLRWAKLFNIPMISTPPGFPPLTLPIMRCLSALTVLHPYTTDPSQTRLIKALDAFFEAYWVKGLNTIDKNIMTEVLEKAIGKQETERVVEMAGKEGKECLLRETEKSMQEGAFGLPWFVCVNSKGEREEFWGVDHLGCVADFLGLERPGTGGWKAVL